MTLKRVLAEGLDQLVLSAALMPVPREAFAFVRPAEESADAVSGGVTWK